MKILLRESRTLLEVVYQIRTVANDKIVKNWELFWIFSTFKIFYLWRKNIQRKTIFIGSVGRLRASQIVVGVLLDLIHRVRGFWNRRLKSFGSWECSYLVNVITLVYQKADFGRWHLCIKDTFKGIKQPIGVRRCFGSSIENTVARNFQNDLRGYFCQVKTGQKDHDMSVYRLHFTSNTTAVVARVHSLFIHSISLAISDKCTDLGMGRCLLQYNGSKAPTLLSCCIRIVWPLIGKKSRDKTYLCNSLPGLLSRQLKETFNSETVNKRR